VRHPFRSDLRFHLLQALNVWLLCALWAVVPLTGAFDALGFRGSAATAFDTLYWVALGVLALLALAPRKTVEVASNVVRLGLSLVRVFGAHLREARRRSDAPGTVPDQWYVVHGGHGELVNGHSVTGFEQDALDIVSEVDGRTQRGDPEELTSYYAYGLPLLAPAAGRGSQVVDGQPDQAIGDSDIKHPAGNVVVIDIGGGRYVMMAHLRPGSIRVGAGDTVRAGQQIGSVGNSGNTSEPHLHIHVQNQPTIDFPDVDDSTPRRSCSRTRSSPEQEPPLHPPERTCVAATGSPLAADHHGNPAGESGIVPPWRGGRLPTPPRMAGGVRPLGLGRRSTGGPSWRRGSVGLGWPFR
jgi:hypothetical protein